MQWNTSTQDLDTQYIIPQDTDYVACSAPYENTTITITDLDGGAVASSGNLGTNGLNFPHHYIYNTPTTGGLIVTADQAVHCYHEHNDDEHNIWNRVMNRKPADVI